MRSVSSQHDSSSSNDEEDSVDDTFDFMKSKLSKKAIPKGKSVVQSVDNSMEQYKAKPAMENINVLGKPRAVAGIPKMMKQEAAKPLNTKDVN
jgi:hypothetical protein